MTTVFAQSAAGEIEADFVHQDEHCVAFRDIQPQAPVHVLIIPRKPLVNLAGTTDEDRELLGHLLGVAREVARQEGLEKDGYRLVMNIGPFGGQTVDHLHLHVMGGRPMSWPPG